MNRTMRFNRDNTCTGTMTVQLVEKLFNQGLYFVENDFTLIMHQLILNGQLADIANVYN